MNNKAKQLKTLIEANGSKFFGVEFVKADGTLRTLNGHYRAVAGHDGVNPTAHIEKYITIVLAEKDGKGNPQFRNVNTETIKALHIGGKRIVIGD